MNKKKIQDNIETAFSGFTSALHKHSNLNQKRADGGWSVGEIANHIIKSTNTNFGNTALADRPYDQHAADIKKLFLNFEVKFPAVPFLVPDSKQYSLDPLLASLNKQKESVIQMIRNEDLTELCVDIALPGWGNLTKYEWLVLMENHIIRHSRQVNDFHS